MKGFSFIGKQVIIRTNQPTVLSDEEFVESAIFKDVVDRFVDDLEKRDSNFLAIFPESMMKDKRHNAVYEVLKLLVKYPRENIIKIKPEHGHFFKDVYMMHQFVEQLYNFWRNYERYMICYSSGNDAMDKRPYRTFNDTIEHINHLVRKVYRDICENITGDHDRVYRQMAAGCQIGIIATEFDYNLKEINHTFNNVSLIRQVLIEPPLILDPPMNKRGGVFKRIDHNPVKDVKFDKEGWLCYPAKVADVLIYVYYPSEFIGLGTSLANLFNLAEEKDLDKKPDAVYVYGAPEEIMKKYGNENKVFFEDEDIFIAAVPEGDEFGYFGYLKKMMLTLHNIIAMKKGRMPLHGAMVRIILKDGKQANVVIIGDTGVGKSETLEALRILAGKNLKEMTIIFDDMGSLGTRDNKVVAYGTETGAFVRLDDLQPDFAFGNIDRSIIMSPQKINARALLPITTQHEVMLGQKIDFFLYANNFEKVDDEHPVFEMFESAEKAMPVFEKGMRLGKGTTHEKGLLSSYYGNPFGPIQYKELHEPLAKKFFEQMFEEGTKIGQMRTMLAIEGFEKEGPLNAAKELFELIREN